jgi:Toprim domain
VQCWDLCEAVQSIDADEDVTYGLHIGEGLETCLAAMLDGLRPIWALGSAGAFRSFPPLAGIECLTIIVDNDPNGASQEAALHCSRRCTNAGQTVRRILPKISGHDFNDIIIDRSKCE